VHEPDGIVIKKLEAQKGDATFNLEYLENVIKLIKLSYNIRCNNNILSCSLYGR